MAGLGRKLLALSFQLLHRSRTSNVSTPLADHERERRELVYFGKLLHQREFVAATEGNLSTRTEEGLIVATPTGISKGMMQPEDMVIADDAGRVLRGSRNVSSEIGMHLTIYRMRPDVRAVVHAHPCIATGFASAGFALDQPLCCEVVVTLGSIPLAPYATTGTPEVSESLKPFIPDHNAILMANHGVVTYGCNLNEAYLRMEAVEHFARIVLVTKQLGKGRYLDQASVNKLLLASERYHSNCGARVSLREEKNTESAIEIPIHH